MVGVVVTSQTAQAKLVQLADFVWKLAVVLNHIDVVGRSQDAGEARGMRIPQRGRYNR